MGVMGGMAFITDGRTRVLVDVQLEHFAIMACAGVRADMKHGMDHVGMIQADSMTGNKS